MGQINFKAQPVSTLRTQLCNAVIECNFFKKILDPLTKNIPL